MLKLTAPAKSLSRTLLLAPWLVVALAAQSDDPGLKTIRADALKGHIYFLASDEMGGRDSPSPEGRIAAQYIAGFFHRAGLKPAGDRGTYFQSFPMAAGHIDREHTYLRAAFGKVLPNASYTVVPSVGHLAPLEAPAALAEAIRTALTRFG